MPSTLPIPLAPLLVLYLIAAGLALFVTRPSTGLRAVVLTVIIGVAMLAGISFAVESIINKVADEASWYYDQ
jgi:hypothetical protein